MTGASVSMNGPPSICGEDLWQRRARSRRDHALRLR
jgi:hypothetical protein